MPRCEHNIRLNLIRNDLLFRKRIFIGVKRRYDLSMYKWNQRQRQMQENDALEKFRDIFDVDKPTLPYFQLFVPRHQLEMMIHQVSLVVDCRLIIQFLGH